jgi:Sortase and related acyltransferases
MPTQSKARGPSRLRVFSFSEFVLWGEMKQSALIGVMAARTDNVLYPWAHSMSTEPDMPLVTLTPETLPNEHICCAISDKKCVEGYAAKKQWLAQEYERGYRFTRLDERGKVFLEYGPGAECWQPVLAPEWMVMGCFWVSGKFRQQGYGKALLMAGLEDARQQGLAGMVAVVGKKKMHFQSDGKWLLKQGFREVDELENGFSLLALKVGGGRTVAAPRFADSVRAGLSADTKGITVFYSNRCPFTEFHIHNSLMQTCGKRGLTPRIVKLDSLEKARAAPTPATIFSLFVDDRFVTTDLSVCMDSRFDKILEKAGEKAVSG